MASALRTAEIDSTATKELQHFVSLSRRQDFKLPPRQPRLDTTLVAGETNLRHAGWLRSADNQLDKHMSRLPAPQACANGGWALTAASMPRGQQKSQACRVAFAARHLPVPISRARPILALQVCVEERAGRVTRGDRLVRRRKEPRVPRQRRRCHGRRRCWVGRAHATHALVVCPCREGPPRA